MYNLPYHKEKNPRVIEEFITRHPLAFIIGCNSENLPVTTQIPFFIEELEGKKTLRGHIMRNTDHHKAFVENENVLVVFNSQNVYVSGTWYSNPSTPSTWNYISVHVRGKIRFVDNQGLIDIMRKTTLHFEGLNSQSATIFDNLSPEFTARLMHAIVGFEIQIDDIDTVFKLSQDRDEQSYHNIIEQLRHKGDNGLFIANEMQKRAGDLFPKS